MYVTRKRRTTKQDAALAEVAEIVKEIAKVEGVEGVSEPTEPTKATETQPVDTEDEAKAKRDARNARDRARRAAKKLQAESATDEKAAVDGTTNADTTAAKPEEPEAAPDRRKPAEKLTDLCKAKGLKLLTVKDYATPNRAARRLPENSFLDYDGTEAEVCQTLMGMAHHVYKQLEEVHDHAFAFGIEAAVEKDVEAALFHKGIGVYLSKFHLQGEPRYYWRPHQLANTTGETFFRSKIEAMLDAVNSLPDPDTQPKDAE